MVGRSSPKLKFETFDQVIKEIERQVGKKNAQPFESELSTMEAFAEKINALHQ